MSHKVFIVLPERPLRPIREIEVEISVKPKTTWAIAKTGRKYLLGTSAFYTMKAAQRCKLARLQKIAATPGMQYSRFGAEVWWRARDQLTEYAATGTIH